MNKIDRYFTIETDDTDYQGMATLSPLFECDSHGFFTVKFILSLDFTAFDKVGIKQVDEGRCCSNSELDFIKEWVEIRAAKFGA